MSKNHKKRNRNWPPTEPEPPRHRGIEVLRQFIETSPPRGSGDAGQIPISAGNGPEPAPAAAGDAEIGENPAAPGSRGNAVKESYRSKLLFSPDMFATINATYQGFNVTIKPANLLEDYLTRELARSSTQDEKISEQLVVDSMRVMGNVAETWDMQNTSHAEKLGSKLSASPQVIAGLLSRSKHGTIYMIKQFTLIDDAIITNGGVDEEQRQVIYDLMGIDHVYRNGSRQVPAASDKAGLRALVAKELGRHRANLANTLDDADLAARKMAALGIVSTRDSATRLLRADQNRARRRFSWAWDTLMSIRSGVDPAGIIDPDTGKPVTPGPRPTMVRPQAQAAASAPTTTPPPASAAPPQEQEQPPATVIPALPEGLPADAMEMFLVAAGSIVGRTATVSSAAASGAAWPPPTA